MNNFVIYYKNTMSFKKIFIIGFIAILLAAIPLTVYLLQQQQETRSRATAATTLSFIPSTRTVKVGDTFDLDIQIDPGSNIVTFVKLFITYDTAKLGTAGAGLVANTEAVPVIIDRPKYENGTITVSLSPGADISKFIQTKTKIATVTFRAVNPTDTTATAVAFGTQVNQTQILSSASTDQASENVLSNANSASIAITSNIVATPTSTQGGTPTTNQPPVCTSLSLDRTASGTAPFPITFTVNGNDPDGTINTVTFDFGDGPVQTVSQGNGIGTNSVSVPIAHTYQNPGTFKAMATLTDNNGGLSTPTTCTQTITVTQGTGGNATSSGTVTPTEIVIQVTPTPTTAIPVVSISPTGPGDTFIKIGGIGAVLTIIGGLLFFAL